MLQGQLTLRQHKELLSMAGWLAALVGCVEYDSVNRAAAEAIRQTAWKLGDECGDAEVMACSVQRFGRWTGCCQFPGRACPAACVDDVAPR
jgi:hypothetical protein